MPIVPAGSTNLAAAGVPNVIVQITPPNPLLNGVPTDIIGMVGTAIWGPTNSAQVVGPIQEFVSKFGNPQPNIYDMGTQVYLACQQGANSFRCVRVTDGTDTQASLQILDTNSAVGATLYSKYTGSLPNDNCFAAISTGSNSTVAAPTYKLTIYFGGGVPEVFDNIGGEDEAFWSNLANAVNLGQSNLRGPSSIAVAVTGNFVSSVAVVSQGSYATIPSLSLSSPGSGAVLYPRMTVVTPTIVAAGTGYAVNDTIAMAGGTFSIGCTVTVQTVKVVSTAVNAGGSNYSVGDTLLLAGGTYSTPVQLTVLSVTSGAIATFSVTGAGSYTVKPSSFTQLSSSGAGTGATFNTIVWGANSVSVTNGGVFTLLPSNPVAQFSTSGSGSGITFAPLWGLVSVGVTTPGTGYTSQSRLVVSGGGGAGGATGTVALGSALDIDSPASYTFTGGTDGNLGVVDSTLIGSDVSPRTGMYALRGSPASICVLADQTDPDYFTDQASFGLSEGMYMMAALANMYAEDIAGAVAARISAAVSTYAIKIMQGDWILINDPFNGITRFCSPQGDEAGTLAAQLPSGSSLNKIMNGIVATQKSSLQQIYSDADLLELQTNGIDVIANQLPVSPTSGVFGSRLGVNCSGDITTNGDNYTRMINFLSKTFTTGLGQYIGLPQTPTVQAQARATLQAFLQNLATLGLIGTLDGSPAFRVTLDSSNNPANQVALGFMTADVQVTLFSIVQRFVINLQAGQSVSIQVAPVQLAA